MKKISFGKIFCEINYKRTYFIGQLNVKYSIEKFHMFPGEISFILSEKRAILWHLFHWLNLLYFVECKAINVAAEHILHSHSNFFFTIAPNMVIVYPQKNSTTYLNKNCLVVFYLKKKDISMFLRIMLVIYIEDYNLL